MHAPSLVPVPMRLRSSPLPHCTRVPLSWPKSLHTFSSSFSFMFNFLTTYSVVSATAL